MKIINSELETASGKIIGTGIKFSWFLEI